MKPTDSTYLWSLTWGTSGGARMSRTAAGPIIRSRPRTISQGRLPGGMYPTKWEVVDTEWHRMPEPWKAVWRQRGAAVRQSGYVQWKSAWLRPVCQLYAGHDAVLSVTKSDWVPASPEEDTGAGVLLGWRDDRCRSALRGGAPLSLGVSALRLPVETPACNGDPAGPLPIPLPAGPWPLFTPWWLDQGGGEWLVGCTWPFYQAWAGFWYQFAWYIEEGGQYALHHRADYVAGAEVMSERWPQDGYLPNHVDIYALWNGQRAYYLDNEPFGPF